MTSSEMSSTGPTTPTQPDGSGPRRTAGRLTLVEWSLVSALVIAVVAASVFAFRFVTATDPPPLPGVADVVRTGPAVHGYLISADDDTVVVELGNAQRREFAVRDQERARIGLPYLKHHAGTRESGFLVFYGTEAGRDYILGAIETDIPLPGQG